MFDVHLNCYHLCLQWSMININTFFSQVLFCLSFKTSEDLVLEGVAYL